MKTESSFEPQFETGFGPRSLQTLFDLPPEFIEMLPVAAYACDAAGRVLWFNKRAADLWGRAPRIGDDSELFCGSHRLYFDGREISREETPMAAAMRSGEAIHGAEGIVERPDGSRIWATVHIEPVKDAAGKVIGAINCFHDTTELHQTRTELAEREANTRQILEAMPVAVYTTDESGRITYYNRAAATLAGREPALGSDEWCVTWKLYWPNGTPLPHDQCPMALALREKRPNRGMEAIAERPDGTRVPFIPYPTPLFDESGVLTGAVNMLVDISERKAAEEALRASKERLAAELEATQHLQEISAELIHQQDVESLHQKIVDAAAQIMKSEYASMQMLYPERGKGGELRLLASRGFNPQAAAFWEWVRADSESTCGEAMRTGRRAIAPDVETCDYMAGTADLATYLQAGIHAVQSTPLVSRTGRLLGMLSTHWNEPHDPAERELRLLDVLARQAADLIERSRAEERQAVELADARRLQAISTRLIPEDDIDVLLADVVSAAIAIAGADRGTMQMFCEKADNLHMLNSQGFDSGFIDGFKYVDRETGTSCGAALRDGKRVVVADFAEDDRFRHSDAAKAHVDAGIRAAQSTPLVSRSGKLVGMLSTHWNEPHAPDERELRLLDVLARQATDLIERSLTEERLRESAKQIRVLMREVNHRSKNLLVVVQSIARRTASAKGVSPEFEKIFSARLQSLSASQDLLVRENWKGVPLSDLVRSQLAHHSDLIGERIAIEGPPLDIGPAAAQSIGMALHELSTNAVKYGALRKRSGRVEIRWNVVGDDRSKRYLEMSWIERDGPPVIPPERKGFGSTVIERLLMQSLDGKVVVEYPPEGLRWWFGAPVSNVEANEDARPEAGGMEAIRAGTPPTKVAAG